jgi:hypothetical protein
MYDNKLLRTETLGASDERLANVLYLENGGSLDIVPVYRIHSTKLFAQI